MIYRMGEDSIDDQGIAEYVRSQHKYCEFDSKIEYAKLKRKLQDGPLFNIEGIQSWLLVTHGQRYYCRPGQSEYAYVYSDDPEGLSELIDESKRDMQNLHTKDDPIIADMSLDVTKLNDGHNGFRFSVKSNLYKLKDLNEVSKRSRKQIKKMIGTLFEQWLLANSDKNRTKSSDYNNQLPSKLLKTFLDGNISWEDFCVSLKKTRLNKET